MALPLGISLLAWLAIAGLVAAGTVGGLVATGKLSVKPGGAGAFYSFPGVVGASDFSVLSITKPNVLSTSDDLTKLNWLVLATVGGGQSLAGTVTPEQTKAMSGMSSKFPLIIKAAAGMETATYPVLSAGQNIFRYEEACVPNSDSSCVIWRFDSEGFPSCPQGWNWRVALDRRTGFLGSWWTVLCIRKIPVATVGTLDNPTLSSSATFTVSNGGTPISETISSRGQTTAEFRDSSGLIAKVSLTGGLLTGMTWDDPARFRALYATNQNWAGNYYQKWKTVLLDSDYKPVADSGTSLETFLQLKHQVDRPDAGKLAPDYRTQASGYHSLAIQLTRDTVRPINPSQASSGTESAGSIVAQNPAAVMSGLYSIWVRADWLGVVIPVGKPQIVSVDAPSFLSGGTVGGGTGTYVVTVKNIGDGQGTFQARLSSCSVTQLTPTLETAVTIQPLATGKTYITVSGTVGSGSCTVTVCDVNMPSVCDSKTFATTVTEPQACIPGVIVTSGQALMDCVNNQLQVILTCPAGQFPVATTKTCATKEQAVQPSPGIPQATAIPTPIPGGFVQREKIPWLLIVVAGVIIAMIVGVVAVLRRRGPRMPPQRGMPGVR